MWTAANPGWGEPDGILSEARLRSGKADALRALQIQLTGAQSQAQSTEWTAISRDAFALRLEALVPEIDLLIRGLDAQAAALETYSVTVDEIQGDQRLLEARRTTADSDLYDLQWGRTDVTLQSDPFAISTADRDARREEAFETTYATIAAIDALWQELSTRRSAADAACVSDLGSEQVLGATAWFGSNAATGASVNDLIARVNTLSATDLAVLIATDPGLVKRMLGTTPETVSERWEQLAEPARLALIAGAPALLGSLNGLPALARIAANRLNAGARIAEIDAESATVLDSLKSVEGYFEAMAKLKELELEREYLQAAEDGLIQLYLYDRDGSRIVEMLGTPSDETRHRITYVPGTMSNMGMFYDGSVQRLSQWFVVNHPDTVAFVYKDGLFPGDSDGLLGGKIGYFAESALRTPVGVADANSAAFAERTGPILADFETGLAFDHLLADATSTAIGHSWGLANITSAEVAGAHYDSVVSLSGAWMPEDWTPSPTTTYTDFSYQDILQSAQDLGVVGEGINPRSSEAFNAEPYYQGPKPLYSVDGAGTFTVNPSVPMDNHNLVATDDVNNREVLRDLQELIYE